MQSYYSRFFSTENPFKKPGILVIVFSACFAFWYLDLWKPYNTAKDKNNFVWDVFGYYSYLPAIFCNNGSFEFTNGYAGHNPMGPVGTHLPKYTYGMSVMYAPFFALGYKIAWNEKVPLDGFSEPFATCIRWGSIFYVLLGIFFLRKFLLAWFSESVVAVVLFSCLFGTMLFMYTFVQSEMSHGYLFCLFSTFLLLTSKWHLRPRYTYTMLLGFVLGLISLIRPTEMFILLFFIFWNVRGLKDVRSKGKFFIQNFRHLLVLLMIAVLMWLPQLFFYKHHAGSYFYFPYSDEGFFWNDPQIMNILFSYRKGWVTYTPLVLLAFVGIFMIKKEFPVSKWVLLIATAVMIYIYSCWWDWGYGGSFGAREFCQHIAYLSIPLAFVVEYVLRSSKEFLFGVFFRLVTIVFIFSCICLNVGQTYQYQVAGLLHFSGMTKEVYWETFRNYHHGVEFNANYSKYIKEPDYKKWKEGKDRDH